MKEKLKTNKRMGVMNWTLFTILIIYTLSMFILFLWGISTSLKTRDEWSTDKVWFPDGWPWTWGWSNFETVISNFVLQITTKSGARVKIMMDMLALNSV